VSDVEVSQWQRFFPNHVQTRKSKDEWSGPCPFDDCDSVDDGFKIWPSDNNYWCRKCGRSGRLSVYLSAKGYISVEEAARQLREAGKHPRPEEIEYSTYGTGAIEYFAGVPDEIAAWIESHYSISREVQRAAYLGLGVPERQRQDTINQRLLIPIPAPAAGQWLGWKGRTLGEIRAVLDVPYSPKYHGKRKGKSAGDPIAPAKWIQTKGTAGSLYGTVQPGKPLVHCGEGELKQLCVVSLGYAATSGTSGAGFFDVAWVEQMRQASEVFLLYDADSAGAKGAMKAYLILKEHAPDLPVYLVVWPSGVQEGHDINAEVRPIVGFPQKRQALEHLLRAARQGQQERPAGSPPTRARRAVTYIPQLDQVAQQFDSLDDIRYGMVKAIVAYLSDMQDAKASKDGQLETLLLMPPPGTGKTTTLVGILEHLNIRAFYAAPRKDMWETIQAASREAAVLFAPKDGLDADLWRSRADEWYNLRPRSYSDEYGSGNCIYAYHADAAQQRKHKVYDLLCAGVCGLWGICEYSKQFRHASDAHFVFGRHQHLIGNTVRGTFDVVVLDEDSRSAFFDVTELGMDDISLLPGAPEAAQTIARALVLMLQANEQPANEYLFGPDVIPLINAQVDQLTQGTETLATLLAAIDEENPHLFAEPLLSEADEVFELPLRWFPSFWEVVRYELMHHSQGAQAWNSRLCMRGKHLEIIQIHKPKFGSVPIIVADATASPRLYEHLLGRPVRVYEPQPEPRAEVIQVVNRQNGKMALSDENGTAWLELVAVTRKLVAERPNTLIITHKEFEKRLRALGLAETVKIDHYGGVVGTNDYKHCDQVILAGTPMPPVDSLIQYSQALFWRDPVVIDGDWITRLRPYNIAPDADGNVPAYPVSEFADDRANLLLEQVREVQMYQALERIRTLLSAPGEKRVVLLSNIPLHSVRVTKIMRMAELLGGPRNAKFDLMRAWLVEQQEQLGVVAFGAIDAHFSGLGWSKATIQKHRDAAIEVLGWETYCGPTQRGRPPKLARPHLEGESM